MDEVLMIFCRNQPNLIFSFSKLILLNDTYKYVVVVPSLTIKIVKRFAYARQLRCRAIGNWSKRRQTETSTTKTSTNWNVDKPKRRQTKTSTDQNVDKPKRRQTKTSTYQNVYRPKCRHSILVHSIVVYFFFHSLWDVFHMYPYIIYSWLDVLYTSVPITA